MGLFDFLRPADINAGVEEFRAAEGALLLDVRTAEEYASGHIPGSVNLPLDRIGAAAELVPDRACPLFVYCRSGARSAQAAAQLGKMGYEKVKNIGGIAAYKGKVEY